MSGCMTIFNEEVKEKLQHIVINHFNGKDLKSET